MFADRTSAGHLLAQRLVPLGLAMPLVLALPRGGVPVAHEVALALGAPLGVQLARKLGSPHNPELAMGALAVRGQREVVVETGVARTLGLGPEAVARAVQREREEIMRRAALYGAFCADDVRVRTVILVDDGVATGATVTAALRVLRAAGARGLVVAVPVASAESLDAIAGEVDRVVCLHRAVEMGGVGAFYRDCSEVSDDAALALLADARSHMVG
jgi:putative phosphoribosyl transferase